jgi:hypothetical protein
METLEKLNPMPRTEPIEAPAIISAQDLGRWSVQVQGSRNLSRKNASPRMTLTLVRIGTRPLKSPRSLIGLMQVLPAGNAGNAWNAWNTWNVRNGNATGTFKQTKDQPSMNLLLLIPAARFGDCFRGTRR